VNSRLGNLRRGTSGTGISNLYQSGTLVTDSSSLLEIPGSQEVYKTTPIATYISNGNTSIFVPANGTIRQSPLLTTLGESIQISSSNFAQFIRAQ
jgi:hypothetical protein